MRATLSILFLALVLILSPSPSWAQEAMDCPSCQSKYDGGDYCPKDGSKLREIKNCRKCDKHFDKFNYCPWDGTKLSVAKPKAVKGEKLSDSQAFHQCPDCRKKFSSGKYCPAEGTALKEAKLCCKKCSKVFEKGKFCNADGAKLSFRILGEKSKKSSAKGIKDVRAYFPYKPGHKVEFKVDIVTNDKNTGSGRTLWSADEQKVQFGGKAYIRFQWKTAGDESVKRMMASAKPYLWLLTDKGSYHYLDQNVQYMDPPFPLKAGQSWAQYAGRTGQCLGIDELKIGKKSLKCLILKHSIKDPENRYQGADTSYFSKGKGLVYRVVSYTYSNGTTLKIRFEALSIKK
ncbi:MAG: hypothetical protein P1V97_27550 [Planctomycetota bacterium]|nr:hypothetical protein [Planctomycetota bacterium]